MRPACAYAVVESIDAGDLGCPEGCCESLEAQGVLRGGNYRARRSPCHHGCRSRSLHRRDAVWITFGLSNRRGLLAVAHTDEDDTIRIISARAATRPERRL